MSGAKALLDSLEKEGVSVVFGIPGGAILPIYDELLESNIRHVLGRHEQSVAHMADGYARASGRTGVCFATSGPGVSNLVTGIATAYMDSSPIVAVTGQVARNLIGTDAFQETDAIGITSPITKHNLQPRDATEIPRMVKTAFHFAKTGRSGPVLIDIPIDVQSEKKDIVFPERVSVRGYVPFRPIEPDSIRRVLDLILDSSRPVILAGGGLIHSEAFNELLNLSEMLKAPVATSLMGKGGFPENHPLSLGTLGMHGSPIANKLFPEADLLIGVGFRFSNRTTGKIEEFCSDAKIVHIDIDEAEMGKNKRADVSIISDAKKTLSIIIEQLKSRDFRAKPEWHRRLKELKKQFSSNNESQDKDEGKLKPAIIIKAMRKMLPSKAIVTTEVGQNQMWTALYFKAYMPRTFISSGGLGTMGFGFPAAIGAKVAVPKVSVVDIAGDGSFVMTMNSLGTSVAEKIPVIVVILNNRSLGMVAQLQRYFYGKRYSAVELDGVDLAKLAEAYGAQGFRPQSLEEFEKAFKKALKSDVTTVIDVPINPDEDVLPMIPLGKGLKDTVVA